MFETPSTENIDSILYEDPESVDSDETINTLHDKVERLDLSNIFVD